MVQSTQKMLNMSRLGLQAGQYQYLAKVFEQTIRRNAPFNEGTLQASVAVNATGDGSISISMAYYGWILNNGFKAFLMKGMQGKTIPMRLGDGRVIFRKVTNVGAHQNCKGRS